MMEVNLLAVLGATIVAFVLGGLWYSPLLFGNVWSKAMGFTEKDIKRKGVWKSYLGNFISTLVMGYVLAYMMQVFNVKDLFEAVEVVALVWVGFILTLNIGSVLWEKKSIKLFLINTGFNLVQLLAMATVLVYFV